MAVNQGTPSNNNNAFGNGSNADTQTPETNAFSSANMAFGLGARLSVAGEGEYFSKLLTKFTEMVKPANEANTGPKIHLVRMAKQDSFLRYSCIIVASTVENMTAAHCLIIEKTGDVPTSVTQTYGQKTIEFLLTPGDAVGDKLTEQAQKFVAQALSVDPSTVRITDSTLVPNEFSLEVDSDIKRLLSNAISAVDVEIDVSVRKYAGINIREKISAQRNGRFTLKYSFNNGDDVVMEANNLPVNNQVCISVNYTVPQARNSHDVHNTQNSVEIVRVYGYIDFDVTNGAPRVPNMNQAGVVKTFTPNFIITDFVSNQFMLTPDILMLGVVSCASLNEDMNWLQSFRTTVVKKGDIDYNDIGGLNVKGNTLCSPTMYGTRPKTKEKDFTMAQLYELVRDLVNQNIRISIDVPKVSPSTWYMSVFGFAAERSPNGEAAAKRIFAAINRLSNGEYTKIRNGQAVNPFSGMTNLIHGGYYRTKNGMRDIRSLTGILPLSNYLVDTNQPPELLEGYIGSLYNSNMSSEIRAAERKKYIDMMSMNTAVYKQMYTRYSFSGEFLMDAIHALNSAGFTPVQESTFGDNEVFQRRAFLQMDNSVLGNDVRVTSMNPGYGSYGGYTGSYSRPFN